MNAPLRSVLQPPTLKGALPFHLLLVGFAALPLFVWPAAHDAFVLPKWVFLVALAWLGGAVLMARAAFGEPLRIPLHAVNGFLVLLLLWQTLSLVWSAAPTHTWDQVRQTAALIVLALLFQNVMLNRRDRLVAFAWVVVAAGSVVAIWALWLDFRGAFAPGRLAVMARLGDWRDIVSAASLGNSGHVADFLVLSFFCALGLFALTISRRAAWLLGGVLVLHAAALIVCWSVHSNLGLILGVVLWCWLMRDYWYEPFFKRHFKRFLPLGAVWLLVVLFFVVDHPANPHGSRVWSPESEASGGIFQHAFSSDRWKEGGSTRWVIWMTSLEIVRENPWLGSGAGTFTYAYPGVRSEAVWQHDELYRYSGQWTNAAHNELLQAWSETGIPGAALLVLLVGSAFLTMNHRRKLSGPGNAAILSTGMAMLLAWCVHAQMNFPLQLPVGSLALVLLVSLPIVLPLSGQELAYRIPLFRDYPLVRVGATIENVKRPIDALLEWRLSRAGAVVFAVAAIALSGAMIWKESGRLAASVAYRHVYEGMRNPLIMGSAEQREGLRQRARWGLEQDPWHWDLRSALADLLLQEGRLEEAAEELPAIRARLNALEVYSREGVVYRQLGRHEEADAAWDELFARRPDYGASFPGEYREWLIRHEVEE